METLLTSLRVLIVENCPYESRISGRTEVLPASVAFLSAKGKVFRTSYLSAEGLTRYSSGSDLTLIKLALEAFGKAGLPTVLKTGRTML